MNSSNWNRYIDDHKFDRSREGYVSPCMDVIDRKMGRNAPWLRIRCSECSHEFWAAIDPTGGGANTVVREDSLRVQCPGCGCEWDGEERRYYSFALLIEDGDRVEILGSIQANDPVSACEGAIAQDLIPRDQTQGVVGIQVVEIDEDQHRSYQLRKEALDAMEDERPDWHTKMLRSVRSDSGGKRRDKRGHDVLADLIDEENVPAGSDV